MRAFLRGKLPRNWSALYQQRPAPETGNYFRDDWCRPLCQPAERSTLSVDETMAMPTGPSFKGDTAARRWAARDPLLNLRRDAQVIGADFIEALPCSRHAVRPPLRIQS
jgi:hypothetical protein